MDLLNLKDNIPALQAAGDELVAQAGGRLDAAIGQLVSTVVPAIQDALGSAISEATKNLQAVADKAIADLVILAAQQDGWTLTITVPPITIRLNQPKESQ